MTKRIREAVAVTTDAGGAPVKFRWRRSWYRVVAVFGHWREDGGYWTSAGIAVPQRDLWRVEACNGAPASGIYELVREAGAWHLGRVWD